MKKVLISFIAVALTFGMAGLAGASVKISFLDEDSFAGVDGDTSGWSTNDSMVQLSTSSWPLLEGMASVYGYLDGTGKLTQRGTRGLGIYGNEDDEVDSLERPERIEITFPTLDYYVNSLEVRSLFIEGGDTEQGVAEFWLDGSKFYTQNLVAVQSGGDGVLAVPYSTPKLVDKLVFRVPTGETYTSFSEFAVARLDVTPIPEPASIIVWSLIGGLSWLGLCVWRRRRRKPA